MQSNAMYNCQKYYLSATDTTDFSSASSSAAGAGGIIPGPVTTETSDATELEKEESDIEITFPECFLT